MKRVTGFALSWVATALLCVGCQQQQASPDGKMVQIGTTRADLFGLPQEYRTIHPHLEKTLEGPVMFRSQPNGAALGEQLRQGLVAYAFMSAAEFCDAGDVSGLKPVAEATNALGRTSRKAFIVIKAGSHLKGIADCKAKRFGFGMYKDVLTDKAARAALEKAGVPVKDLLPELLTPPPLGLEGRLYLGHDVAKTIVNDPTVNAGVIDELDYAPLKDTGGTFLMGPSKDQFTIVGETAEVPEFLVVAGPAANPRLTEKLKQFLLHEVKGDERICKDLNISGFAEPNMAAIDAIRDVVAMK